MLAFFELQNLGTSILRSCDVIIGNGFFSLFSTLAIENSSCSFDM